MKVQKYYLILILKQKNQRIGHTLDKN